MKWSKAAVKIKPVKYIPKQGDKREVSKFAYFPVLIGVTWIWWENYIASQEYCVGPTMNYAHDDWPFGTTYSSYTPEGWVTYDKRQ